MPGYIHPLSAVGIGSASGDETSLNLIVKIKSSAQNQNTANSGPVGLKKWFEKFAITPDFDTGVYTNVKWSEFKESAIFGCTIAIRNETYERYGRNNNGGFRIIPLNGSLGSAPAGTFNVTVFASKGGAAVSSTNFSSQTDVVGFDAKTYYITLTNTHPYGDHPTSSFSFYWKCDYNSSTGGQIRSDPTDTNSFNGSTGNQETVVPTSQTGDLNFSDPVTLLCKPKSYTEVPVPSTP